jgi:pyruvate dehydrogenase E2 component (dihydrolipoamide acetyltransferase)
MSEWERTERLDFGRRLINDSFLCASPVYGTGVFWVDMEAAATFLRELREAQGIRVGYLHLVIRACGVALAKYPQVYAMIDRERRIVYPGSIDIGVSVEGTTNVAPVVVLTEVDKKDLATIVKELREGAEKSRAEEASQLRKINWLGRLLPFRWLRRLLIPIAYRSARVRRRVVGNFQITSLNEEMIIYNRLNASTILFLGQVRERPAVIEGRVVPRRSAYLSLGVDHRVVDGALPMRFMHEVIRLLESPQLLLGAAEGSLRGLTQE